MAGWPWRKEWFGLALLAGLAACAAPAPAPKPAVMFENDSYQGGGQALFEAAANECNVETVTALLQSGVDPNARDYRGRTALMVAVGSYDNYCPHFVTRTLLDGGAQPNLQDQRGDTALHWLVRLPRCNEASLQALAMLLQGGADPSLRNLAGRSATAAKEIQELITDSVTKVEQGNQLVAESGKLLSEIIENVRAVADTIAEISAASQEQAAGIEEVNKAVAQMDESVQQNAALVEEAASTSETSAQAARELRALMERFTVRPGRPAGEPEDRE